ncbi:MAG: DUF2283 domain-containing protein [Nanoarchaeota archaeon]
MADTKNMNMQENKERHLEAEGEMSYDYANDTLLFKVKDREYDFSLEFQNMVIDVDNKQFIVGIQIFDASKFLGIEKQYLKTIPKWRFKAKIKENIIEIRIFYQINIRNKIIEKNPIIIQENKSNLPSPQMVMTV